VISNVKYTYLTRSC